MSQRLTEHSSEQKRHQNYLLYFFAAALDGLVGVDTGGDGGQFLLFLTQAHLRVHAVDKAFHYCRLVGMEGTPGEYVWR